MFCVREILQVLIIIQQNDKSTKRMHVYKGHKIGNRRRHRAVDGLDVYNWEVARSHGGSTTGGKKVLASKA